jgi:hypothetical protein
MMAGIFWDKQAMTMAHQHLQSLRLGAYLPSLAQLVAVGGVKLTMDTFRAQRDPYGSPWAPLARERTRDRRARLRAMARGQKPRGQKILIDKARMKNSTTAIHVGRSGGVAIPTGYAAVHQNGARITRTPTLREQVTRSMAGRSSRRTTTTVIPQRMMLPDQAKGLPRNWQLMIHDASVQMLTRWGKAE